MQSRQLSQVPLLVIRRLTHVLRPFVPLLWPGRRKEVPERARAGSQVAACPQCLPRVRAPKVQRIRRRGSDRVCDVWAHRISLYLDEFKRYALAPDTKTP